MISPFFLYKLFELEIMTDIKKIYLDMDGVLVNDVAMFESLEKGLATEVLKAKVMGYKQQVVFPLIKRCIDKRLFSSALITPFGMQLQLVYIPHWLKQGIEVEILTSTMKYNENREELEKQKLEWLESNSFNLPVNFARGSAEKQMFAKPGSLLIDDYDRTINQWLSSKGHAIHHTHPNLTYKALAAIGLGIILND